MNETPWQISIPHRWEILYTEGDHSMSIEVDMTGPYPSLYRNTIRSWKPPYDGEPISETKRSEIVQRILRVLREKKGCKRVEVVD
jgi:hypothetical protein